MLVSRGSSAALLALFPAFALASFELRGDLHFPLQARGTNKDGSTPKYKNPKADIEDRVKDLLPRMTLQEKVAQLIQGDINMYMNMTDALDDTLTYNATGLAQLMATRAGAIWAGYSTPWEKLVYTIDVGQRFLMHNTTLGIPAIYQTEGLHGFTNNGTIFPSPLGIAASFNPALLYNISSAISDEAEGLGLTQVFAPVLDMSRELRWGRVEENFGEDPYLTGEMGHAYVTGLQTGSRRAVNATASSKASTGSKFRMAATCKHFAAFGSPQGGLNIAPVAGGERELRSIYLPAFKRACADADALAIMSAYSSYDGVPATANQHLLNDILRDEWKWPYLLTGDAGSLDLLYSTHGVCPTGPAGAPTLAGRECAAAAAIQGWSMEMGGGTYVYELLPQLVQAGQVKQSDIDTTVASVLRTKFALGLFENPYPYPDYKQTLRTGATRALLHQVEREQLVLLKNSGVLPLSPKTLGSVAILGPQAARVSMGDYVFFNASNNGIAPLEGVQQYLSSVGSAAKVNYAEGCKLWSNDESGFAAAVDAAKKSDVAVVFVGTWTRDQTLLWTPGQNATTGEHNDLSTLDLVGAQRALVQAVVATGKPTVVVFVSGKPVTEPWIAAHANAIVQQFYPGELGGTAIAELLFGAFSPSGKLPVSFPRSVGTAPAFYNYLKGARPLDPGAVLDDGNLKFGHQYVLDSPVPLWSFGQGLSYVNFTYSDMALSASSVHKADGFSVSVTVANRGARDAAEVVQVYATDAAASIVTANTALVGFAKVSVPAGGSTRVTVPVRNEQLKIWSARQRWEVEPGNFTIRVGTSVDTYASATLAVVG